VFLCFNVIHGVIELFVLGALLPDVLLPLLDVAFENVECPSFEHWDQVAGAQVVYGLVLRQVDFLEQRQLGLVLHFGAGVHLEFQEIFLGQLPDQFLLCICCFFYRVWEILWFFGSCSCICGRIGNYWSRPGVGEKLCINVFGVVWMLYNGLKYLHCQRCFALFKRSDKFFVWSVVSEIVHIVNRFLEI